jgi:hypothetical protein
MPTDLVPNDPSLPITNCYGEVLPFSRRIMATGLLTTAHSVTDESQHPNAIVGIGTERD